MRLESDTRKSSCFGLELIANQAAGLYRGILGEADPEEGQQCSMLSFSVE
jgi:hypothetical protein